jgi:hypothetical protein
MCSNLASSLPDVLSRTLDLRPVDVIPNSTNDISYKSSTAPRIGGGIPQDLLPYAPSLLQSIMGVAESDDELDLGPETKSFLDNVCRDVKGVDKYAIITRERIEEKDGSFLPGESVCNGRGVNADI